MICKQTITGCMQHKMKTNNYWTYVASYVNKQLLGVCSMICKNNYWTCVAYINKQLLDVCSVICKQTILGVCSMIRKETITGCMQHDM